VTQLRAIWLGRMAFEPALELQLRAREALVAEQGPPTLFLVEHPPTLTIGRRGRREDILWSDELLAAQGVAVCDTPRGGEVTLHAPGQLVCYPIVHVGRRIREHLVDLGEVTCTLLAELGVDGTQFRMEHPGVWAGERKLASIGVHISRGVSVQGLSLNLDVDPSLFSALVSCGMRGIDVVSATGVGGRPIAVCDAATRWAELYAERIGTSLAWSPPAVSA
jgi:lipoyl(octanoyl) transferase